MSFPHYFGHIATITSIGVFYAMRNVKFSQGDNNTIMQTHNFAILLIYVQLQKISLIKKTLQDCIFV